MAKTHTTHTTQNGLRTEKHVTTTRDDGSSVTHNHEIVKRGLIFPDITKWTSTVERDADGNTHIKTRK